MVDESELSGLSAQQFPHYHDCHGPNLGRDTFPPRIAFDCSRTACDLVVQQPNGERQLVGGTNNEAERTPRSPAEAPQTGRTNKTLPGAHRQTILTSGLQSLRLNLPTFTLASVIAEVNRWIETGRICLTKLLRKLELQQPAQSVLDRILAQPSG